MPRYTLPSGTKVSYYDFKRGPRFGKGAARTYRRRGAIAIPVGRGSPFARHRPRFRNARTGGFLGQELKFYDTSLAGSAITAPTGATGGEHDPSATILLNTVVQGDGEQQRDGRKIVMKSLYVNGNVVMVPQANQTATDAASVIYIAVVLDTQTNGATIASEDVFTNVSADALLAPMMMRNLQQSSRFRILGSKRFTMQNPNLSWDGTNLEQQGLNRPWSFFINLKNMSVLYKGTTETVANIVDNSLHIVAFTNSTALTPLLYYNSRLRFVG